LPPQRDDLVLFGLTSSQEHLVFKKRGPTYHFFLWLTLIVEQGILRVDLIMGVADEQTVDIRNCGSKLFFRRSGTKTRRSNACARASRTSPTWAASFKTNNIHIAVAAPGEVTKTLAAIKASPATVGGNMAK
jgi:hypothetical protein